MAQDPDGFMWFGGQGGLIRYDGIEFKFVKNLTRGERKKNSEAGEGNRVFDIYFDALDKFWLASGQGLLNFNAETESFVQALNPSKVSKEVGLPKSIVKLRDATILVITEKNQIVVFHPDKKLYTAYFPKNIALVTQKAGVNQVFEDSRGRVWVATDTAGVFSYDPYTQRYETYGASEKSQTLSHNKVHSIEEDKFGYLWFGTQNGLNRFDPSDASIVRYMHDPDSKNSLSHNVVNAILESTEGELWIATENGLNVYKRNTDNFITIHHDSLDSSQLASQQVSSLYESKDGILWLSYTGGGASLLNRQASLFNTVYWEPAKLASTDNFKAHVRGGSPPITQDMHGNVWFSQGSKLGFFNTAKDQIEQNFIGLKFEGQSVITSLLMLSDGNILIGTVSGELSVYDPKKQELSTQINANVNLKSEILSIFEGSGGRFWFGTSEGLFLIPNLDSDYVVSLFAGEGAQEPIGAVYDIFEDNAEVIWVGTEKGAFRYSADGVFLEFIPLGVISNDAVGAKYISQIVQDDNGNYWFAVVGAGLTQYLVSGKTFKRVVLEDGLPSNRINTIVKADAKYLWLGSERGISRFNPSNGQIKNFNQSHGLVSNSFGRKGGIVLANGKLIFSSKDGFSLFDPSVLQGNGMGPKVSLLSVSRYDEAHMSSSGKSAFNNPKPLISKNIELHHARPGFTVRFIGIDYLSPQKVNYAYRLLGHNEDWFYSNNVRLATYIGLSPGVYRFEVKAVNEWGAWSQAPQTIAVTVLPAWWQTWWFYVLCVLLLGTLLGVLIYTTSNKQQATKEKELNRKLLQVDKLKDEFLANTSHELRTPLNGIIGLSESLIDGIEGDLPQPVVKQLQIIVNSAKRLTNLVNDILDFSRLRKHTIVLDKATVDLFEVVNLVVNLSKPLLGEKSIVLINDIASDLPCVEADEARLQQILFNLVGNAIKFTNNGSVKVYAEQKGEFVKVCIQDTGMGIAEEDRDKVFAPFQLTSADKGNATIGAGLGLAVTKQLVELHGSQIELISSPDIGSTFSFLLPIASRQVLTTIDDGSQSGNKLSYQAIDASVKPAVNVDSSMHFPTGQEVRYHLLIVDDEPVNRQVLINLLTMKQFQVTECSSGMETLKLMDRMGDYIDLVLLDVMMPGMSGYEVCQSLRQKFSAHRLPILFLTAKNQVVDLEAGYAAGANDYLTKPIIKEELLARVNTHLELLEIGRNLEQTVSDRTSALMKSHEELKESMEQLKRAQSQLVQTEKMSSLGALVAGIGHELNNPAHFTDVATENLESEIESFKQFLLTMIGDDVDKEIREAFEERFLRLACPLMTIKGGVERIGAIVANLRNFSRANIKVSDPEHLKDNLLSTLNLVKINFKEQVDFVTELKDDPLVECLPSELNQVFMNLMVNACQAIIEKQVALDDHSPGMLLIKMYADGEVLVIELHDSGAGISQDVQGHIFEPFFTTKPKGVGTGLGLSITYDIVKRNGGEISVHSEPGEGTVFELRFPIYRPSIENDVD